MTFRVRIDPLAQREIDEFGVYTGAYSEEFAIEQFARLREIFSHDLGEHPLRSTFFALNGAPYRAYLFRVGRRSRYWIIYTADEYRRAVHVLRFWNASRHLLKFEQQGRKAPHSVGFKKRIKRE